MEERVLVMQWLNGIKIAQISHIRATNYYNRIGRFLGIAITIASTLVSTSIFSSLTASQNPTLLIITGTISIFAAIFSGLQTFLNYPELAAKHRTASLRYSQLRRYVEEILTDDALIPQAIKEIRTQWSQIEDESPDVPSRFHETALKFVKPELSQQRSP
jgi:hypothetical protein